MNPCWLFILVAAAVLVEQCYTIIIIDPHLVIGGTVAALTLAKLFTGAAILGALTSGSRNNTRRTRDTSASLSDAQLSSDPSSFCVPFNNPELYFRMAAEEDVAECGQRYVCELEAVEEYQLAQEERLLKGIFGLGGRAKNSAWSNVYHRAGELGANSRVEACSEAYPQCRLSRKDMYKALQKAVKAQ